MVVAVPGYGAGLGIFRRGNDAERASRALSIQEPQYEYDVYRVGRSDDMLKGIVARYKNGSRMVRQ